MRDKTFLWELLNLSLRFAENPRTRGPSAFTSWNIENNATVVFLNGYRKTVGRFFNCTLAPVSLFREPTRILPLAESGEKYTSITNVQKENAIYYRARPTDDSTTALNIHRNYRN